MADSGSELELDELRRRLAALEKETPPPPPPPRHRARSLLAVILILLACLLTPLAVVSSWTKGELTDTDRYVATVTPLAKDPAVQAAVTDRVTTAVMQHLPINSLLDDIAPADRPLVGAALGRLGNTLTDGLTSFVHTQVGNVVAGDAFVTVWVAVNRNAHAAVDRLLTGEGGGAVQIQGNAVTLDLAPVIDQVKTRLVAAGLGVAARIPEVHTSFTLVQSDTITKAQTGLRLLQLVGFWLPVLVLVLAVAGVLLAARRRRAAVTAAFGVAAGAAVLGIALSLVRAVYLDKLPAGVDQAAAGAVFDALVHHLRVTVRAVLVLGVLVALGTWVSGPGRRAGQVRQLWQAGFGAVRQTAERFGLRLGPVGRFVHRWKTWLSGVALAVVVLLFVLWDYPSGLVVFWLAVGLVGALAVLEFLDEPGEPGPAAAG